MHAGLGDILFYGNLSLHLGYDQPLYGLQAKGVNGTEHPSSQMEEMANFYITEIRKVQPEGPYYLAGYCLGAMIAFEIAQQLKNKGQRVALLANFNGISPTYRSDQSALKNELQKMSQIEPKKTSNHISGRSIKLKAIKASQITRKQVRALSFKLMFDGIELLFNSCLLFRLKVPGFFARLNVGQSLQLLQSKYKPKPYEGSMIIFRSPGIYKDRHLGWKNIITGTIKTFDIPGIHETRRDIMNEPHVQILAEGLKNFLDN
jgi:hypothetical protein